MKNKDNKIQIGNHASFSKLSNLDSSSLEEYFDLINKPSTEEMMLGSVVESIIDKVFDKEYFLVENKIESKLISAINSFSYHFRKNLEIANIPLEESNISPLDEYKEEFLEVLDFHEYRTSWKKETRLNKAIELCREMFVELVLTSKSPVSETIYNKAVELSNILSANKRFTYIHSKASHRQLRLTGEIFGVPVKGFIDYIVPRGDGNSGTGLTPITIYDLKTTINFGFGFQKAYYKYKLWLQSFIYMELARQNGFEPEFYFIVQSKSGSKKTVFYKSPNTSNMLNGTEYRWGVRDYFTAWKLLASKEWKVDLKEMLLFDAESYSVDVEGDLLEKIREFEKEETGIEWKKLEK